MTVKEAETVFKYLNAWREGGTEFRADEVRALKSLIRTLYGEKNGC